jgi:diguanylate cyclase (GGDEF)-like protein
LEIKGAVLFVGLDRFKIINDSLGHTAGDEMLKMVSQRLQSVCEESTLVGRFGGDEFLILTRGAQTEASVASFCLVLTTAIAEPMEVAGRQLQIGISIGVRLIDAQCRSVEEVLRDADTALHAAKTAGRSSVVFFEDSMREQLQARIKLEGDLSEALRARQFEVFFQPIVRLKDLSHAGFEALVRWRHPDGSYVSASDGTGYASHFRVEKARALAPWVVCQHQCLGWSTR